MWIRSVGFAPNRWVRGEHENDRSFRGRGSPKVGDEIRDLTVPFQYRPALGVAKQAYLSSEPTAARCAPSRVRVGSNQSSPEHDQSPTRDRRAMLRARHGELRSSRAQGPSIDVGPGSSRLIVWGSRADDDQGDRAQTRHFSFLRKRLRHRSMLVNDCLPNLVVTPKLSLAAACCAGRS
jgi:hypothetical protein